MDFLGKTAVTTSKLHPVGKADFDGNTIQVVAKNGWIEEGTRITVIQQEGNHILVEPISETTTEGATT